jgi:hypothetical protein
MAPRKAKAEAGEKRKSPYRSEPNDHYEKNMNKIDSERMFITKITDSGEYGDIGRSFSINGNTGSYTVKIGNKMDCNCTAFVGPYSVQTCNVFFADNPLAIQIHWTNLQAHAL